ncbi:Rad17-domain-containing protein, partial [Pseudovirgaria hyperparasitica]
MVKPRGTRKRPVVLSSDDDDDQISVPAHAPSRDIRSSTSLTPEPSYPLLMSAAPKSSTKSVSSSPQKDRKKEGNQPVTKDKAIYSFFNRQTQKQNQHRTTPPAANAVAASVIPVRATEDEDYIQDDSMNEDDLPPSSFVAGSAIALAVKKRSRDALSNAARIDNEAPLGTGQKFLKTDRGRIPTSIVPVLSRQDTRPWMERFGPKSLDELAVHKKKVVDVQTWLRDVFEGRIRKRLLILKGPAGSGKTTTLQLLSEKLKFDIQEWKNPTNSLQTIDGFVSITSQFEEFMSRTGKFHSLDIANSSGMQFPVRDTKSPKQAILIEEFPTNISYISSALQAFRSSINQYLAANAPPMDSFFGDPESFVHNIIPLVIIISETLLSSTAVSAETFTAHRLLGQGILNHPSVTIIEFNPIAPTILSKALDLVVIKESRQSGRRKTPGPQVIKRLAEAGDVRSAISSLEFLCLRGDEQDGWGSKVSFAKTKKGSRGIPLTKMEEESLTMVTHRENTLGIFHSVGKVVYNKRLESDARVTLAQPPGHLPQHRRSKVPEVQVNTMLDELGTDIQTFISALHENYAPSCNGPSDEESLDSLDGSIEALSDADILSPEKFSTSGFARRTFQGTALDNLRQEEISFQVAVRGLLFNLPHPVKRQVSHGMSFRGVSTSGKAEVHQMFWPTSLRLWRKREEVEGLLDLWTNKAQNGTLLTFSGTPNFRPKQMNGGVETWKRAGTQFPDLPASTLQSDQVEGSLVLASGNSARCEMLLERLPYMVKIYRNQASSTVDRLAREFEKVTTFQGIEGPSNEEPE